MSNKHSLSIQDSPSNPQVTQQSHSKRKKKIRVKLFKYAFKAVEVAWMFVQIIHYIYEILGK